MRYVDFDPDTLSPERRQEWDDWIVRAADATDALLKSYVPGVDPAFDSTVWKDLKEWLFDHVFDGRCAYCEAETDAVSWGDGEHWRPKGAVTTLTHKRVKQADGTPHPGYYWLAYEWSNLLPACERCNRGKGKGTRFPIEGNYVTTSQAAATVEELDALELPLLLHPFRDQDPGKHIGFNELGQPVGLSEKGETSIRVFNLQRDVLNRVRQKRRDRMKGVADQIFHKWLAQFDNPNRPELRQLIDESVTADDELSLAKRVYLTEHVNARLQALMAQWNA